MKKIPVFHDDYDPANPKKEKIVFVESSDSESDEDFVVLGHDGSPTPQQSRSSAQGAKPQIPFVSAATISPLVRDTVLSTPVITTGIITSAVMPATTVNKSTVSTSLSSKTAATMTPCEISSPLVSSPVFSPLRDITPPRLSSPPKSTSSIVIPNPKFVTPSSSPPKPISLFGNGKGAALPPILCLGSSPKPVPTTSSPPKRRTPPLPVSSPPKTYQISSHFLPLTLSSMSSSASTTEPSSLASSSVSSIMESASSSISSLLPSWEQPSRRDEERKSQAINATAPALLCGSSFDMPVFSLNPDDNANEKASPKEEKKEVFNFAGSLIYFPQLTLPKSGSSSVKSSGSSLFSSGGVDLSFLDSKPEEKKIEIPEQKTEKENKSKETEEKPKAKFEKIGMRPENKHDEFVDIPLAPVAATKTLPSVHSLFPDSRSLHEQQIDKPQSLAEELNTLIRQEFLYLGDDVVGEKLPVSALRGITDSASSILTTVCHCETLEDLIALPAFRPHIAAFVQNNGSIPQLPNLVQQANRALEVLKLRNEEQKKAQKDDPPRPLQSLELDESTPSINDTRLSSFVCEEDIFSSVSSGYYEKEEKAEDKEEKPKDTSNDRFIKEEYESLLGITLDTAASVIEGVDAEMYLRLCTLVPNMNIAQLADIRNLVQEYDIFLSNIEEETMDLLVSRANTLVDIIGASGDYKRGNVSPLPQRVLLQVFGNTAQSDGLFNNTKSTFWQLSKKDPIVPTWGSSAADEIFSTAKNHDVTDTNQILEKQATSEDKPLIVHHEFKPENYSRSPSSQNGVVLQHRKPDLWDDQTNQYFQPKTSSSSSNQETQLSELWGDPGWTEVGLNSNATVVKPLYEKQSVKIHPESSLSLIEGVSDELAQILAQTPIPTLTIQHLADLPVVFPEVVDSLKLDYPLEEAIIRAQSIIFSQEPAKPLSGSPEKALDLPQAQAKAEETEPAQSAHALASPEERPLWVYHYCSEAAYYAIVSDGCLKSPKELFESYMNTPQEQRAIHPWKRVYWAYLRETTTWLRKKREEGVTDLDVYSFLVWRASTNDIAETDPTAGVRAIYFLFAPMSQSLWNDSIAYDAVISLDRRDPLLAGRLQKIIRIDLRKLMKLHGAACKLYKRVPEANGEINQNHFVDASEAELVHWANNVPASSLWKNFFVGSENFNQVPQGCVVTPTGTIPNEAIDLEFDPSSVLANYFL